jgi:hypothetical protein
MIPLAVPKTLTTDRVKVPTGKSKRAQNLRTVRKRTSGREAFTGLCAEIAIELVRRTTQKKKGQTKRQTQKLAAMRAKQLTLLGPFLGGRPYPSSSRQSHTSGPNTPLRGLNDAWGAIYRRRHSAPLATRSISGDAAPKFPPLHRAGVAVMV